MSQIVCLLLVVQHIQHHTNNVNTVIGTINNIDLLTNHRCHTPSQHNHLDKLLIAKILFHIQNSPHNVTICKIKSHNNIKGYDEANKLAIQGPLQIPSHSHNYHSISSKTTSHIGMPMSLLPQNLIVHMQHQTINWKWIHKFHGISIHEYSSPSIEMATK